jgi:hypothetical protein
MNPTTPKADDDNSSEYFLDNFELSVIEMLKNQSESNDSMSTTSMKRESNTVESNYPRSPVSSHDYQDFEKSNCYSGRKDWTGLTSDISNHRHSSGSFVDEEELTE